MTKLGEIKVAFRYSGIERQKTYATVRNSAGEVLVVVHVKRAIGDVYDKSLGRLQAFKKAMTLLMIRDLVTREQRKEAWMAYQASIRVPDRINLGAAKRIKKARVAEEQLREVQE